MLLKVSCGNQPHFVYSWLYSFLLLQPILGISEIEIPKPGSRTDHHNFHTQNVKKKSERYISIAQVGNTNSSFPGIKNFQATRFRPRTLAHLFNILSGMLSIHKIPPKHERRSRTFGRSIILKVNCIQNFVCT